MNSIKEILKKIIPNNLIEKFRRIKNLLLRRKYLDQWKKNGFPIPPPHIVKEEIIKKYAQDFNIKLFIETGSYLGDMIAAVKNNFSLIYSIELGHELYLKVVKRFKNNDYIKIIEGDSSKKLKELIPRLNQPGIFWLDGHYSGGITVQGDKNCPIFEELEAIFSSTINDHIILIDDARLFNGQDGYPKLEELKRFIEKNGKYFISKIENDIIQLSLYTIN